ncbi:MAG: hypothetical protein JWM21_1885 [Acidobacteria bacterium]|nr:hypothetical protein [Acidobacteriota bacterium]
MKTRKTITISTLVGLLLALFPIGGRTQHLYNKERDEQAQKALPLAEALKSGQLFDTQLKNLASLSKRDFETEFLVTKFQINAFSLDLLTWEKANTYVCLNRTLNSASDALPKPKEIDASLKELKASIADAKTALDAFKASVKKKEDKKDPEAENEDNGPILASLLSRLGDMESVQKLAEGLGNQKLITPKTLAALDEVKQIAGTLKTVYDAYTAKVDAFNELGGQLADLRIVLKKVAIESLQVDEQHWKNVAAIRARREVDRADVLSLINEYMGIMKRLRLVDFGAGDPLNRTFCTASNNAVVLDDGIDIRPRQLISEHIRDLIARAAALDKDNREILREARVAIAKMKRSPASSDFSAIAGPTVLALRSGLAHIDEDNIIHQYELDIRNGDLDKIGSNRKVDRTKLGLSDDLNALDSASHGMSAKKLEDELRLIVIHRQRDMIRTRDMVADVPRALYTLAALIARGDTPDKLAELRLAQELHGYSIRKSAVRARAYELTVSTGAQRLALFHKGGIKPTDVAELVFAASNVALTPAILAR